MKSKTILPVLALLAGGLHAADVTAESQRLLGIEAVDLAEKSLAPEVPVFGGVLPPAPLIDLFRQIGVARAAAALSSETLERAGKLFASGELVARKEVQAAEAQETADLAALRGLEDRLSLEWGPEFSKMTDKQRDSLAAGLLAGKRALLRLSVSRGEQLASKPLAARLHPFGNDKVQFRCSELFPAPATDPAFQAVVFFGLMETPDAPLASGFTLNGAFVLAGEPRAGLFVPQDAVLFYLGKGWVYRKTGADSFKREQVPTDTPVAGGWFVAGDSFDSHGIVTTGAQALLSQETAGPAEEE